MDSVDSAADVRIPHKNRLSRLGAMFFHCRAGSASPLKAGDHDRKAERLLYRSLSAFDMDGCSEALNRERYQMVCSQYSNHIALEKPPEGGSSKIADYFFKNGNGSFFSHVLA